MTGDVAGGGGDQSVLSAMGPVTWSPEDGVAYEVALELMQQVVGACSALIAKEESAEAPDTTVIESWERVQGRWAGRERELHPADRRGVESIIAECQALVGELRAMR
jgi:hypothetical protein